jgi:Gluconate 2-dehydrogenase subunit 3
VSRLRLPNLSRLSPADAPPPPTPVQAVAILLSRRQFLKALGAAAVIAAAPWTRVERTWAAARGRFFTSQERRTLDALADSILPPDADPGAAALGATRYIEGLLTAFDRHVPRIYAGGPFSGRQPFIDYERGVPSHRRPRNSFKHFVPLTRLQDLNWRWQIQGTAGLSAADQALVAPLDAQLGGPLPGLRDVYRDGLSRLDAFSRTQAGAAFVDLDGATRTKVLNAARTSFPVLARRDRNFIQLVARHAIEGVCAAPEYGGNARTRGWKMLGLEGDSQPLGYALYSRRADAYRERADHPLSTPNPDEINGPLPLSAEGDQVEQFIVATTGGLGDAC